MVSASRALNDFERAVAKVIRSIPRGSVLAYSQVALRAGKPGGARAVVRALHRLGNVPWWRVVRADRTLALEVALEQSRRLRQEGVSIIGRRIRSRSSSG